MSSHVSRRAFCHGLLAGGAGALMGRRLGAAAGDRPSIILITSDDLGPHLGCCGDARARTPNLDKLASEGVLFTNGYVTQASCSPSRSSMLTGLYPHQNGQIGLSHQGYSMHEGMKTAPALLGGAGYRTGIVGKPHVAPQSAVPFDFTGGWVSVATRDVRGTGRTAGQFIRQSKGKAFFLLVKYFDVHRPLVNQTGGLPQHPFGPNDVEPFPFIGIDSPKIRQEVAGYYNCAARMDAGIGLLMDELAAAGRADDTLVLFLGDHGPPFCRAKTTCYEAGLHVPIIVRWPGRAKAGAVCDKLVSTVDILPTFLDAAGVEHPAGLAGRSLVPLLAGQDVPWRETLCAEYTSHIPGGYYPRRSIRDGRYKLILNLLPDRPNPITAVDGCGSWRVSRDDKLIGTDARRAFDTYHHPPAEELYDLREDPVEFHNLAGMPACAEILARLRQQLQSWREETDDPLLDPAKLAALTRKHDEMAARERKRREAAKAEGGKRGRK